MIIIAKIEPIQFDEFFLIEDDFKGSFFIWDQTELVMFLGNPILL